MIQITTNLMIGRWQYLVLYVRQGNSCARHCIIIVTVDPYGVGE